MVDGTMPLSAPTSHIYSVCADRSVRLARLILANPASQSRIPAFVALRVTLRYAKTLWIRVDKAERGCNCDLHIGLPRVKSMAFHTSKKPQDGRYKNAVDAHQ